MLLQAMADQFGIPVKQYAEVAFEARLAPKFSYGCAVFLDSDRVNFQKEGYAKEELLAGLALVLPKNIWQYVVQIPRMSELGRVFVLQGGTQKNLAALKAQVDYIEKRVPNAEVYLHPHCGEAGAIGGAARPRSSGSIRRSRSTTRRPTTRRRAATSARTTARARSSTPRPSTARPRATSADFRARRAQSRTSTRSRCSTRSARSA
jgi:hypothetical protein